MADTTTANYGFTKPEPNASDDTWGGKLNTNWDDVDTALQAVSDVADAAAVAVDVFHDPARVASYRIIGNTLECWGQETTGSSSVNSTAVTFPKTFARAPAMTITPVSNVEDEERNGHITLIIPTAGYVKTTVNGQPSSMAVSWYAIGEWDGIS